ncbi:hypothetical protein CGRA01v4_11420 [Colletotrichum graminicola]|nr:hypothetical protein CGRA01v4_11420 [Colletotrichum graminicola]
MAFSLTHQEFKGKNEGGVEVEADEGASRFVTTRLNGLRSRKECDAYGRHGAQNGKNATAICLLALRDSVNSGTKTRHKSALQTWTNPRPGQVDG